jgi:DNA primase
MLAHQRVDTNGLKQAHPIADVVSRYGIELRPSGRALIGRCPFHDDRGRPNLHIYPRTASFCCYRCGAGGDAIRFVELIDGVTFIEAAKRLEGATTNRTSVRPPRVAVSRTTPPRQLISADERAVLAAAVELYSQCLTSDANALAYVQARGLDRLTIERHHVGYCSGDALLHYLRWRRLPLAAARRVGLLTGEHREFLADRIVVPAFRRGQPIWLVGRAFPDSVAHDTPKYLGLPGRKPLLGFEESRGADVVWVVEGPFDWLTLRAWHVPAVALLGTRVRAEVLSALAQFPRLVLCLNDDAAGRAGVAAIESAVGTRAVRCPPLPGAKDVNDLGQQPQGRRVFMMLAGQLEAMPARAA